MKEWIHAQYQNAFVWVPFIMAFGAAMYFTCETMACIFGCALAGLILCWGMLRKNKYAMRAAALFIFGMLYAMAYTNIIATPRIYNPIRNTEITGRVTGIDYTTDKTRLFISIDAQQINSKTRGTAHIRLNIPDECDIRIGDKISATASIFPPAMSYAPETFDYARWAYFNKLSGTGFISEYKIITHDKDSGMESLRNYLHAMADSFLGDALVLGYKGTITNDDRAIWTSAGIGHVWSISGFHMTLVSGWLFAIFFLIFRMIPYITRRIPARIPALCCGWVGLMIYLGISGMNVATIRAFLMITLAFSAFIIGRNALSMRNIALAFCVIFLLNPHYVMQPGFQLSFAAIFGLIWFWQSRPCTSTTRIGKIGYAIYAAIMTSVIATIFTVTFVAAHFYLVPVYGLIGNLILLPIFSLIIMPAVVFGVLTAPLGFTLPLKFAEIVYSHILPIAQRITELPHANIMMPHIPNSAIMFIIMGLLCVMLIKSTEKIRFANYILGTVMICTGIIIAITAPRPVFYSAPDNVLVAFSYDGHLEFNKSKSSGHMFAFDTWKQINGEATGTPNKRRAGDKGVWMYKTEKFNLAYIQKFVPLSREIVNLCRDNNIDYIVSYFDVQAPKCQNKILRGGFVIYPSGRVRRNAPMRPWNNPRK